MIDFIVLHCGFYPSDGYGGLVDMRFLYILIFLQSSLSAATYYWVGNSAGCITKNFSSASCWATSIDGLGGAGTPSTAVDIAIFESSSTHQNANCNVDIESTIDQLLINAGGNGYTGTITVVEDIEINTYDHRTGTVSITTGDLEVHRVFSKQAAATITGTGSVRLVSDPISTAIVALGASSSFTANLEIAGGIGATKTLTGPLNLDGNLSLTSGTFDTGENFAINANNFTLSNSTFNANASTVNLTGNLANVATFNANTSTMNIAGTLTNAGIFNAGSATTNVTGNYSNSGTFNANSSNLNLAANFNSAGNFIAGTGNVTLNGTAASTQTISGSTTFNNLSFSNNGARTIQFTDSTTQIVSGTFSAQGSDSSNRLQLRPTHIGTWNMNLTGTKGTLQYLDVRDGNASGSNSGNIPVLKTFTSSNLDSGGNTGWFPGVYITAAETMDSDSDGQIDHYKLTFNTNINDSTFPGYSANSIGSTQTDWRLTGYTGVVLAHGTAAPVTDTVNDTILYVRFNESASSDTDALPEITTTATPGLADLSANTILQILTTSVIEVDKAPPILVSASASLGSTNLVLTFSEPVDSDGTPLTGNIASGDFTFTDRSALGVGGATSISSVSDNDASSDENVTVVVDTAFALSDFGLDTIAPAANAIFDNSNNAAPNTAVVLNTSTSFIYTRSSGANSTLTTFSSAGCSGAAVSTLPDNTKDVIVCNGHTLTLDSNLSVKSLGIASGGTVTAGTFTIDLVDGFTFAGTFNGGTSTVNLLGTNDATSQTNALDAGGQSFYNLEIRNTETTATVDTFTIKDNVTVTNNYTLAKGIFSLDSGPSFDLTIHGDFNQNGANSTFNAEAGNLSIGQDMDISAGTFNAGTSTVVMVGSNNATANAFTITSNGQSFYNLEIRNTETTATVDTFTMKDNVTVTNNYTLAKGIFSLDSGPSFDLTIHGDFNQNGANSTFNAEAGNLSIGQDMDISAGTFNAGTGTTIFTGSNNAIANNYTIQTNGQNLNALIIRNAETGINVDTFRLLNTTTITGDATLTKGVLNQNTVGNVIHFQGNLAINGGTLMGVGGAINLSQSFNYTAGTLTAGGSTVNFIGNGNGAANTYTITSGGQSFAAVNFNSTDTGTNADTWQFADAYSQTGNFTLTSGTVNTNDQSVTISGNHYSQTGGTLNASASTITFNGAGLTFNRTSGTFAAGTSTVVFANTAAAVINSAETFNNVTYSGTNTLTTSAVTTTVSGNFVLSSASTLTVPDGATLSINGNFTKSNGNLVIGGGTSGNVTIGRVLSHTTGIITVNPNAQFINRSSGFGFYTNNTYNTLIPDDSSSQGYGFSTSAIPRVFIEVTDQNRNLDASMAETITVSLTSNNSTRNESETITLTETGNATGVFNTQSAGIAGKLAIPTTSNSTVEALEGDIISIVYTDPHDSSDDNSANPYDTLVSSLDFAPPKLLIAKVRDLDSDGRIDAVDLEFNEYIDDSSFDASQWTFSGNVATGLDSLTTANDKKLRILYATDDLPIDTSASGVDLVFLNGNTISDLSGNKLASISSITESDGASPVIVSAASAVGSTGLTVTFSEPVGTNSSGIGDLLVTDFDYNDTLGQGAARIVSVSEADARDKVVTLTMNAAFVSADILSDTIASLPRKIYDTSNNAMGTATTQIVLAGAPSIVSITANDPDDEDQVYSSGDTITIVFDQDTNQPYGPSLTQAELDTLFTFSGVIGQAYTAVWSSAATLVITIDDASGSTDPSIGALTLTVKSIANLKDASNSTVASTARSPALGGDWGLQKYANSLANARVAPSLFDRTKHNQVRFMGLTRRTTIHVYTVTGTKLYETVGGAELSWNLTTSQGQALGSGVYLIVFKIDGERKVVKMAVVR